MKYIVCIIINVQSFSASNFRINPVGNKTWKSVEWNCAALSLLHIVDEIFYGIQIWEELT